VSTKAGELHPGLLSVFEAFRGRGYTMERERLESVCFGLALDDQVVDDEARGWVVDADPEKLIEIFWTVGFVHVRAVGGIKGRRRSGSEYLGAHQVVNLNLQASTRFQVHPMYRAYLAMKEPEREAD